MRIEKFKYLTRPFAFWKSECGYEESEIVIIPAPYDGTCSNLAGCRKGPFAIIDESMETESYDSEWDIDAAEKVFTLDPLVVFDDAIQSQDIVWNAVKEVMRDKKTPIIIGGDHSLTPVAVFAARNTTPQSFFVLDFDAHSDLREKYRGNSFSHASCMYKLASNGFKITQVGVRSDFKKTGKSDLFKNCIRVFRKKDIFTELVQHLLEFKGENIYISFDFDAYDPSIMPCVGTPEPNGLNFEDVCFVFECLKKLNITILGADFVEFSPHNFQHNAPANLAVRTVGKVISLIALQRAQKERR